MAEFAKMKNGKTNRKPLAWPDKSTPKAIRRNPVRRSVMPSTNQPEGRPI